MSDPDVSDDGYWFGRAEAAIKRCGALRKELAESASEIERLREALRDALDSRLPGYAERYAQVGWPAWVLRAHEVLGATPKESLPVEEVSR